MTNSIQIYSSHSDNEIKRIRIKRLPTNPNIERYGDLYFGYGDFNAITIINIIQNKLHIKPKTVLEICWRNSPFETNVCPFERYGFIDVTGLDNLEPNGLMERTELLNGNTISIIISQNETWLLCLQDMSVNLLRNSNYSITTYVISQNFEFSREGDEPTEYEQLFDSPFNAGEPTRGLGYRDSYTAYIRI